jgi:hypothetical protein
MKAFHAQPESRVAHQETTLSSTHNFYHAPANFDVRHRQARLPGHAAQRQKTIQHENAMVALFCRIQENGRREASKQR